MINDLTRHKMAYSFLAVASGAYLIFVYRYQTNPRLLLLGTIVFSFVYFLWGVLHHLFERTCSGKIVLEYFLVAALALVIVSTLLI